MKRIAFCSCGKDSVAMVEQMIDAGQAPDEVVLVKVPKEFKDEAVYREKLLAYWRAKGVTCTVLETEDSWDRWFFGKMQRGKRKGQRRGFPLLLFGCWWSREAKIKVMKDYTKQFDDVTEYVGYTIDEKNRNRQSIIRRYLRGEGEPGMVYPLVDQKLTEADCMEFCRERGILNPLYQYFDRLGCTLCPKQKEKSLRALCTHFKPEWEELKWYVEQTLDDDFVLPGTFNQYIDYEALLKIEAECRQLDQEEANGE